MVRSGCWYRRVWFVGDNPNLSPTVSRKLLKCSSCDHDQAFRKKSVHVRSLRSTIWSVDYLDHDHDLVETDRSIALNACTNSYRSIHTRVAIEIIFKWLMHAHNLALGAGGGATNHTNGSFCTNDVICLTSR